MLKYKWNHGVVTFIVSLLASLIVPWITDDPACRPFGLGLALFLMFVVAGVEYWPPGASDRSWMTWIFFTMMSVWAIVAWWGFPPGGLAVLVLLVLAAFFRDCVVWTKIKWWVWLTVFLGMQLVARPVFDDILNCINHLPGAESFARPYWRPFTEVPFSFFHGAELMKMQHRGDPFLPEELAVLNIALVGLFIAGCWKPVRNWLHLNSDPAHHS
ncbi:MAG TPA: hypothetical protein PLL06_05980 [Acidobacteriota bacterium]|nr:hypothetical protein [Acidobacteriota bacterium]HNG96169.1 hypothetical protein [Acidobacteriota bacterium]